LPPPPQQQQQQQQQQYQQPPLQAMYAYQQQQLWLQPLPVQQQQQWPVPPVAQPALGPDGAAGPAGQPVVQLGPDQQRAIEAAQQGFNLFLTGEGSAQANRRASLHAEPHLPTPTCTLPDTGLSYTQ
jgi:hypothetical protein